MRTYVYVDGESHFERSLSCWKVLHGKDADLSQIESTSPSGGTASYPDEKRPRIRIEPRAKFFWDSYYPFVPSYPFGGRLIDGAAYYTAFSGDENDYHEICVKIRQQRFDPRVVRELKKLAEHRKNTLSQLQVLEKPKGVDIGLSVRILEDAYHNIFDVMYLFTSDIDFLSVVKVVQRLGKKVIVFGYSDGMGKRSELKYVPDVFVELDEYMKANYRYIE